MEQSAARILVADGEAPIRMTLERLLQHRGYTVTVADRGEEALPLLEQHTFDLLLLDLKLPGISGLDVARTLQPTVAILLLTGHAALDDTSNMLQQGAFEYMIKTASPADVLARVAASLAERASTNAGGPLQ